MIHILYRFEQNFKLFIYLTLIPRGYSDILKTCSVNNTFKDRQNKKMIFFFFFFIKNHKLQFKPHSLEGFFFVQKIYYNVCE